MDFNFPLTFPSVAARICDFLPLTHHKKVSLLSKEWFEFTKPCFEKKYALRITQLSAQSESDSKRSALFDCYGDREAELSLFTPYSFLRDYQNVKVISLVRNFGSDDFPGYHVEGIIRLLKWYKERKQVREREKKDFKINSLTLQGCMINHRTIGYLRDFRGIRHLELIECLCADFESMTIFKLNLETLSYDAGRLHLMYDDSIVEVMNRLIRANNFTLKSISFKVYSYKTFSKIMKVVVENTLPKLEEFQYFFGEMSGSYEVYDFKKFCDAHQNLMKFSDIGGWFLNKENVAHLKRTSPNLKELGLIVDPVQIPFPMIENLKIFMRDDDVYKESLKIVMPNVKNLTLHFKLVSVCAKDLKIYFKNFQNIKKLDLCRRNSFDSFCALSTVATCLPNLEVLKYNWSLLETNYKKSVFNNLKVLVLEDLNDQKELLSIEAPILTDLTIKDWDLPPNGIQAMAKAFPMLQKLTITSLTSLSVVKKINEHMNELRILDMYTEASIVKDEMKELMSGHILETIFRCPGMYVDKNESEHEDDEDFDSDNSEDYGKEYEDYLNELLNKKPNLDLIEELKLKGLGETMYSTFYSDSKQRSVTIRIGEQKFTIFAENSGGFVDFF